MKMNPEIFREYDIRGVVGKDFDAEFAEALGRAYVSLLKKMRGVEGPIVSVGYDARHSANALVEGLTRGMVSSGAKVLNLGLVTTPISYFSTFQIPGIDGAIMVTGSHNPPEYNGFKISVGNSTIYGEKIQQLYRIIQDKDFVAGKGSETWYDIFPSYLERYASEFKSIKNIPVVLDCGNGAAGCIARKFYEQLGLTPTILFEKPDGDFPNHHPDPTVESNMAALIKEVRSSKAKVGIGFDGDCDRIGVVDETGRLLYGDEMMVLISRDVLTSQKGKPIIGDVKCSDRLYDDIEKNGGVPIMWKTGHSLIKQKIKDEKAPFGGEMSGHIFFADRNYGFDDALYASLRVVEILAKTGKTISQLLEGLPAAHNTPEIRIDTTEQKKVAIVEKLKSHFSSQAKMPDSGITKVNLIDGIRVSFKDGWGLARSSNTQPVLVLRFESNTEAGLKKIRDEFEKVVSPLL